MTHAYFKEWNKTLNVFFFISYRCWVDQKCVCACWWRIPGQRPLLRRKEAWWWNYQMQHSQMPSQVRMLICRGQLQLQSVPRFLKKFCPLNIAIFFYKYPGEGKMRDPVNEVVVVPGSSNQPLIIGRIRKRRFGPAGRQPEVISFVFTLRRLH